MSHDQGLIWPRNTHSSRPQAQPALDRPSLFAGMEADADEAPERVRILSTLAASRPPSKRASGRSRAGRGSSWQFKALLALMGLGIVGLLAGFAMVLSQGHSQAGMAVPNDSTRRVMPPLPAITAARQPASPGALSAHASAPQASASNVSPLSTQATASASASASASSAGWHSAPTPQAAVIENVPPAAVAGLGTVAAASPLAALSTAPTAAPPTPPVAPNPQVPARPTAPPRSEPSRVTKATPQPTHAEARPRKPATKRGQDADVALLEAMFTHTRPARTDADKRRLCAQRPQSAGCAPSR